MTSYTRLPASVATEALIQQVINTTFAGQVSLPGEGEQFSDPAVAFQRLQQVAFASGFAVVVTQKDETQQRRRFSCVHFGKTPNKRKLTAEAIRKEVYQEHDGRDTDGNTLRQRQGMVTEILSYWYMEIITKYSTIDSSDGVPICSNCHPYVFSDWAIKGSVYAAVDTEAPQYQP
jgi:hypothetical protein